MLQPWPDSVSHGPMLLEMSFNSPRPSMMPSITSTPLIELALFTSESVQASTTPIDLSNTPRLSSMSMMTPTGISEIPTLRCKEWSGRLTMMIKPASRIILFQNTERLPLKMFGGMLPLEPLLEILKLLLWTLRTTISMLCIPIQWPNRLDIIDQQSRSIWPHASMRYGDIYHSFILSSSHSLIDTKKDRRSKGKRYSLHCDFR